jgi:PAS domain S-box-containing protein
MAMRQNGPTRREITFGPEEIIVSKTDLSGRITYANDVFLRVAGYSESEILGKPHSLIRHPDMPRCVFELLWRTIQGGREIFAYVVNLAKNGDHYWVHAHVTPTFDDGGAIVGYHSNRRCPEPTALAKVRPLYEALVLEEQRASDKLSGMAASAKMLEQLLAKERVRYDELVFSL